LQRCVLGFGQQVERVFVRGFRVHGKQKRTGEGVGQ
jgi:hypothetical protein